MNADLLKRPMTRRARTLRFEGRILYLLDDAEQMRADVREMVREAKMERALGETSETSEQ